MEGFCRTPGAVRLQWQSFRQSGRRRSQHVEETPACTHRALLGGMDVLPKATKPPCLALMLRDGLQLQEFRYLSSFTPPQTLNPKVFSIRTNIRLSNTPYTCCHTCVWHRLYCVCAHTREHPLRGDWGTKSGIHQQSHEKAALKEELPKFLSSTLLCPSTAAKKLYITCSYETTG